MPNLKQKKYQLSSLGLYWDQLWRQLKEDGQVALWDVPPSEGVAMDLEIFQSYFSAALPLIDFGCGSGLQSLYLARVFPEVIGLDISKKAIAMARQLESAYPVSFTHLNTFDIAQVKAFHQEKGDVNIYMRGVLHQIPRDLRPEFIANLKILLGQSGALYLIETATSIQSYIVELAEKFSGLPLSFKRVLTSNLPPLGVSLDEIRQYFDKTNFEVLKCGPSSLATNIELENIQQVALPAVYALVKKNEKKR